MSHSCSSHSLSASSVATHSALPHSGLLDWFISLSKKFLMSFLLVCSFSRFGIFSSFLLFFLTGSSIPRSSITLSPFFFLFLNSLIMFSISSSFLFSSSSSSFFALNSLSPIFTPSLGRAHLLNSERLFKMLCSLLID